MLAFLSKRLPSTAAPLGLYPALIAASVALQSTRYSRQKFCCRDSYACALCDCSQGLQVHHVIPRGEGGTNCEHNLITLCSYCHSHVHGRPLYDTDVTAEDVEQACIEYLADYYAPDWNPWRKE